MTKKIEERISSLEERISNLERALREGSTTKSKASQSSRPISIGEYLKSKNATDDVRRALVIARWFEIYEQKNAVNMNDVSDGFRISKRKVPINVNDKMNLNVKKTHMAEDTKKGKETGKKHWYVTDTGIEFIENELSNIKK